MADWVWTLVVRNLLFACGLPAMQAPQPQDCSNATPAPIRPEYGAVTSHTGMPLK